LGVWACEERGKGSGREWREEEGGAGKMWAGEEMGERGEDEDGKEWDGMGGGC